MPLGIILKNENSHEDMVAIMDHAHQYVPTQTSEIIHVDESGDSVTIKKDEFHNILFGELIGVSVFHTGFFVGGGGDMTHRCYDKHYCYFLRIFTVGEGDLVLGGTSQGSPLLNTTLYTVM